MKALRLGQCRASDVYGAPISRLPGVSCHGRQFHISHKRDPFPYVPPSSNTPPKPPKFTRTQKFAVLLAFIGAGSIIYAKRKKPSSEGLGHVVQSSENDNDTEALSNQTPAQPAEPAAPEDNEKEVSTYPAMSHEAAGEGLERQDHAEKERKVTQFYQVHPRYCTLQNDNAAIYLAKSTLGGKQSDVMKGLLRLGAPEVRIARDNITDQVIFFGDSSVDETSE